MLRIGISLSPTKTQFGPLMFAGDLTKGLEYARSLGYEYIDLSMLDSSSIDQDELAKRIDRARLKTYAISTGQSYINDGFSLYASDMDKRSKAIERIKGHIDLAVKLESRVIIGGVRGRIEATGVNFQKARDAGEQALRRCAEYAHSRNVTLLIEPINRYETNVVNTLQEGIQLIGKLGGENLKLLPDTFHMNIEESSILDSLNDAAEYIDYIHFADSNRLAPGWGHFDFKQVVDTLANINYQGAVGIEILPKPNDSEAARQAIQHLKAIQSHGS